MKGSLEKDYSDNIPEIGLRPQNLNYFNRLYGYYEAPCTCTQSIQSPILTFLINPLVWKRV